MAHGPVANSFTRSDGRGSECDSEPRPLGSGHYAVERFPAARIQAAAREALGLTAIGRLMLEALRQRRRRSNASWSDDLNSWGGYRQELVFRRDGHLPEADFAFLSSHFYV